MISGFEAIKLYHKLNDKITKLCIDRIVEKAVSVFKPDDVSEDEFINEVKSSDEVKESAILANDSWDKMKLCDMLIGLEECGYGYQRISEFIDNELEPIIGPMLDETVNQRFKELSKFEF